MKVRRIMPSGLGKLLPMAESFWLEGKMPGIFNPVSFVSSWLTVLDSGMGVIWVLEDENKVIGTLGCGIYRDLNTGDLVASEFFWYVLPDHRGRGILLLREFEKWAKNIGAKRVIMVHLTKCMPERVGEIYKKMGYEMLETHYVKEI